MVVDAVFSGSPLSPAGHPAAVAVLDGLEATWRGRVNRMSDVLSEEGNTP